MIDEDEDEDEETDGGRRAPTALPEDVDMDEELPSEGGDKLGRGAGQTSIIMRADTSAAGPLLGVAGAGGGGRGGTKPTCPLVRVSTYASSLNQPINR